MKPDPRGYQASGVSNSQGPGPIMKTITGEPLNPNHWWFLI